MSKPILEIINDQISAAESVGQKACAFSLEETKFIRDILSDMRIENDMLGKDKARLDQLELEVAEAGWRCCIDHLLKPEHPCPICKIEELEAENKRLNENMWAAKYCNPTEDLRLARLHIKELEAALAERK